MKTFLNEKGNILNVRLDPDVRQLLNKYKVLIPFINRTGLINTALREYLLKQLKKENIPIDDIYF